MILSKPHKRDKVILNQMLCLCKSLWPLIQISYTMRHVSHLISELISLKNLNTYHSVIIVNVCWWKNLSSTNYPKEKAWIRFRNLLKKHLFSHETHLTSLFSSLEAYGAFLYVWKFILLLTVLNCASNYRATGDKIDSLPRLNF